MRRPFTCQTISPIVVLAAMLGAGCAATPASRESMSDVSPEPQRAVELAMQAAGLLETDRAEADRLLIEALKLDLYCGPAHNNLGVLYLSDGKLYEAASEFEWARKLMPGQPDPRMNLAFTFERAGRVDDALQTYATALEVSPDHVPTIQALCRLQLRTGRPDAKTRGMLEQVALRGESPEWRSWAQQQLTKLREGA